MKSVMEAGDTKAMPGSVGKGSLGSVELADGSRTNIPLINVNGAYDGPILTVVSGIHGTEVSGVGALLKLIKRIDPTSMRGALLGIPGANPLAFRAGAYRTPIDSINLSGPWFLSPIEKEKANISMRMVYYINQALEKADYVIDVHANPLPSIGFGLTNLGLCQDEKVRQETRKMVEAFGLTVIDWPNKQAMGIWDVCLKYGKPTASLELPGNFYVWDDIVEIGARGIMNVMKRIQVNLGVQII